jgi:hypothetical protein
MTTNHTAGPWTYKDSFELNVIQKNNPEAEAICEVTGNPAEQFANAQLIAAAPELLAALIEAQNLINLCRQYMPKSIKNSDRFTFENTAANIIDKAIKTAVKQ